MGTPTTYPLRTYGYRQWICFCYDIESNYHFGIHQSQLTVCIINDLWFIKLSEREKRNCHLSRTRSASIKIKTTIFFQSRRTQVWKNELTLYHHSSYRRASNEIIPEIKYWCLQYAKSMNKSKKYFRKFQGILLRGKFWPILRSIQ
jgi:hypothetical protein